MAELKTNVRNTKACASRAMKAGCMSKGEKAKIDKKADAVIGKD